TVTEDELQSFFEAVEREANVKGGSANRPALAKAARNCQDNIDWLIEDFDKILRSLEQQMDWAKLLAIAVEIERQQRILATELRRQYEELLEELFGSGKSKK